MCGFFPSVWVLDFVGVGTNALNLSLVSFGLPKIVIL